MLTLPSSGGSTETGLPPATRALIAPGQIPERLSKLQSAFCQIKLVDPAYSDLTADFRVEETARTQTAGAAAGGGQQDIQTYVVQSGDTLSKISQKFYGSASQFMKIFEANRDKLSDPNKIQVGQKLTIPS